MDLPGRPVGQSTVLDDVYAALGVRRVIKATCHWTRFGGTIMPPEVREAMHAAADAYVDVDEPAPSGAGRSTATS